jgi:hypothetical protein
MDDEIASNRRDSGVERFMEGQRVVARATLLK